MVKKGKEVEQKPITYQTWQCPGCERMAVSTEQEDIWHDIWQHMGPYGPIGLRRFL